MWSFSRKTAVLLTVLLWPAAVMAQDRAVVVGFDVGGASHMRNLNTTGTTADFDIGFALDGSIGLDITKYFGVHADFTWTRNTARGAAAFAGTDFNRFFYGVHVEGRYPFEMGLTPYVFAGGGAVTVDQDDATSVETFTNPAGMYGFGLAYAVPRTSLEFFGEAKNLVYKWDQTPYDRVLVDLTYAGGLRYRIGI